MVVTDWDPGRYAAFADLRLRPALDLLAQVPGDLPAGAVVDLGCGNGAAGAALRLRFPDRSLVGLDSSATMLAEARGYDHLQQADIADWAPESPPALIFSNAALQWLGEHASLLPRLAGLFLPPGGVLAVQMPRNHLAPSHQLLRQIAAALFPDRFPDGAYTPPVDLPDRYWRMLAPLGKVLVWETEYLQQLTPSKSGHPVRAFTQSTAMRPFLAALSPPEAEALTRAYDAALLDAYPLLPDDGGVLFPFRRLFLVLRRPA